MKTMLGIFVTDNSANNAIDELRAYGFNEQDISVLVKDNRELHAVKGNGTSIAQGAVAGATTGGLIGALAGILSVYTIPGLGALFIGGPIAAALGLTGLAAATVAGATTGLAAGGIIGALMNIGLSEEDARVYESRIRGGDILIAVPIREDEETEVREVFIRHGAEVVRSTDRHFTKSRDTSDEISDEELLEIEESRRDIPYSAGVKGGSVKRRGRR